MFRISALPPDSDARPASLLRPGGDNGSSPLVREQLCAASDQEVCKLIADGTRIRSSQSNVTNGEHCEGARIEVGRRGDIKFSWQSMRLDRLESPKRRPSHG
jgi:hypothetical protein